MDETSTNPAAAHENAQHTTGLDGAADAARDASGIPMPEDLNVASNANFMDRSARFAREED